jgi:hypothetical protein
MRNEILVKSFVPEAAIAGYRIVKFGSVDNAMVQASAASDESIGVSTFVGGDPANGDSTVDVVLLGVAEVELGDTVTRGDLLTSDAQGRAIVATTEGQRIIGQAMNSGVVGDIQSVLLAHGTMAVLGQA